VSGANTIKEHDDDDDDDDGNDDDDDGNDGSGDNDVLTASQLERVSLHIT
jgi:hypothetical protein